MLFAATGTDLEIIMLSEVNQSKTNTIRYHFISVILKNDTFFQMLFTKQKQT